MKALIYLPNGFYDAPKLEASISFWPIKILLLPAPNPLLEEFAARHNLITKTKKPNWKLYGRHAPMMRDERLMEWADLVIVFIRQGDATGNAWLSRAGAMNKTAHAIYLDPPLF